MKKRLLTLILIALALTLLLPTAAFAAGEDAAQLPHVTDNAGLLSDTQRQTLETRAAMISAQHECSVYIVTVDDYERYANDVYTCATDIFTQFDLGWGGNREGVLLLLSMEERDYALICHGYFGNEAFTDYGREVLAGYFKDDFRQDDWYSGLFDFVDGCDELMTMAENGQPLTRNTTPIRLVVVILVPLLAAFLVCTILKSQMKTARLKTEANEYIAENGVTLLAREDIFTHRTEHREVVESSSGGRSGGGGGFSGSTGKF